MIGETEPPRKRQKNNTNFFVEEHSSTGVDGTSHEHSQSIELDPEFDHENSDGSVFEYDDEDCHSNSLYDYSEGSLHYSDYQDFDNMSDEYDDYEDNNNRQNHHENNEKNHHVNNEKNHHESNTRQQPEVIDGIAFEQPLDQHEAQQNMEVLDGLAIYQVENSYRRINFILQPSYNLEDDLIDLFLNVMINDIAVTGNYVFVHNIHYFTYPMLLNEIDGLVLTGRHHVQIIGDTQSFHWRCLYYDGKRLKIYDSLPDVSGAVKLSNKKMRYIKIRYPHIAFDEIEFPHITRQPFGTNTCGIYAAAVATTLVLREDPTRIQYSTHEDTMRFHYHTVVAQGNLMAFPSRY